MELDKKRTEHGSRGFTRKDLVVMMATSCLLLPLLTVASQRSGEDVRRVQCRSNLRDIDVWLKTYAAVHDGRLPGGNLGLGWGWDLSRNMINNALEHGLPVSSLYCPSGPSEGTSLHYDFASHLVVGTYLIATTSNFSDTNINYTIEPTPITVGDVTFTPTAAERELAADPTISVGTDKDTARFEGIWGGSNYPHRAPHLDGDKPAGGNVLFLDGHVEWRNFSEMSVRSRYTGVAFWY